MSGLSYVVAIEHVSQRLQAGLSIEQIADEIGWPIYPYTLDRCIEAVRHTWLGLHK